MLSRFDLKRVNDEGLNFFEDARSKVDSLGNIMEESLDGKAYDHQCPSL